MNTLISVMKSSSAFMQDPTNNQLFEQYLLAVVIATTMDSRNISSIRTSYQDNKEQHENNNR